MTRKNAEYWLDEAENDYEIAEILLKSSKFNGAVFHFVQSAKKGIKALLHYLNAQPWGHSIHDLLCDYEKMGFSVNKEIKKVAKDLDVHYISSRYPNSLIEKSPKELYDLDIVKFIEKQTKIILNFVEKRKEEMFKNVKT